MYISNPGKELVCDRTQAYYLFGMSALCTRPASLTRGSNLPNAAALAGEGMWPFPSAAGPGTPGALQTGAHGVKRLSM